MEADRLTFSRPIVLFFSSIFRFTLPFAYKGTQSPQGCYAIYIHSVSQSQQYKEGGQLQLVSFIKSYFEIHTLCDCPTYSFIQ